ncbi:MAG: hypothetical protein R2715_16335 [Ilumatobacteraceae bacterium]
MGDLAVEVPAALAESGEPILVIAAGHDQFCPAEQVAPLFDKVRGFQVVTLPTADHFLAGHLLDIGKRVAQFLRSPDVR